MTINRIAALALAAGLGLGAPAAADPTLGLGLTFAVGTGTPDVGLGLRVFSDDEEDSTVASVGMDYLFTTQSWRATAGVARLMDDKYIGADMGLRLTGGGIDFGMTAGLTNTKDDAPVAQTPQTPPPPFTLPPTGGPQQQP